MDSYIYLKSTRQIFYKFLYFECIEVQNRNVKEMWIRPLKIKLES